MDNLLNNRIAMTDLVPTVLTSDDLYLFNEGRSLRLYEKLGAHRIVSSGPIGVASGRRESWRKRVRSKVMQSGGAAE